MADLSPCRLGFDAGLFHYRFCGGQSGTGTSFSPSTPVSPVSTIPPLLHTHPSICHHAIFLATVSAVKHNTSCTLLPVSPRATLDQTAQTESFHRSCTHPQPSHYVNWPTKSIDVIPLVYLTPCSIGYPVPFPESEAVGTWFGHPPPSRAEVKERELHFYYLNGPSIPIIILTSPFPFNSTDHHHHHHHHHISVMQLGHLLTRSGVTYPEVSSKVYHDSFCQTDSSVSLPWVIYF